MISSTSPISFAPRVPLNSNLRTEPISQSDIQDVFFKKLLEWVPRDWLVFLGISFFCWEGALIVEVPQDTSYIVEDFLRQFNSFKLIAREKGKQQYQLCYTQLPDKQEQSLPALKRYLETTPISPFNYPLSINAIFTKVLPIKPQEMIQYSFTGDSYRLTVNAALSDLQSLVEKTGAAILGQSQTARSYCLSHTQWSDLMVAIPQSNVQYRIIAEKEFNQLTQQNQQLKAENASLQQFLQWMQPRTIRK